MGWAYNCSGGCIAPHCLVDMATASSTNAAAAKKKLASDVRRGDVVSTGCVVQCVVKVRIPSATMRFVRMGRTGTLLVSPYHPVAVADKDDSTGTSLRWQFPEDVEAKAGHAEVETSHMYSFVLAPPAASKSQQPPSLVVDGVHVVSFAHGFKAGSHPVLGHAFFGTATAVEAIQRSATYETEGVAELVRFVRDPVTLRIVDAEVR